MSLTRLANTYSTDKGTLTGNTHAYSCVYDIIFRNCTRIKSLEYQ